MGRSEEGEETWAAPAGSGCPRIDLLWQRNAVTANYDRLDEGGGGLFASGPILELSESLV